MFLLKQRKKKIIEKSTNQPGKKLYVCLRRFHNRKRKGGLHIRYAHLPKGEATQTCAIWTNGETECGLGLKQRTQPRTGKTL